MAAPATHPRSPRRAAIGAIVLLLALVGIALSPVIFREARARLGRRSVADRLAEVGPRVGPLWRSRLDKAGVTELPARLTIVTIKSDREVIVFGTRPDGADVELARYPITAASGTPGPKLREGDRQVPEGVYRVESLNPNSRYRLSLRVDYPSADDVRDAGADGRDPRTLGGDIMIHGGAGSIGCVAIGDPAIEELFWLVATVGYEHVELLFAPDAHPAALIKPDTPSMPPWLVERYHRLDVRLKALGL